MVDNTDLKQQYFGNKTYKHDWHGLLPSKHITTPIQTNQPTILIEQRTAAAAIQKHTTEEFTIKTYYSPSLLKQ